ncbi:MAG: hypothetical protein ACJ74Y_06585 [Bryobacteraceae bacterium]
MRVALPIVFVAVALSSFAGPSRLIFIKSFPGSVPEYVWVSVDKGGSLEYKESQKEDEQPVKAQLPDGNVAALFALADKLGYFNGQLESGLKVANTGKKTFRYEPESGTPTEAVFNYSLDVNAQQLLEKFEQIAASERSYIGLDRTVHFDKLGVNDALAELESLWLRKQLVAPLQFVPLLERISSRPAFMHLARERAARLKEQFTGLTPQATSPAGSDGKAK